MIVKGKSVFIAAAIMNCVSMICWTALAVFFGKWWIALFCVLTYTFAKSDDREGGGQE